MTPLLAVLLLSLFSVQSETVQDGLLQPVNGHEDAIWASPDYQQQLTSQLLNQGLEAEVTGNFDQALRIWSEARMSLESPSVAIGVEYIRLVTEQSLDSYYPSAVDMYNWGLTGESISVWNQEALREELDRLEPVITTGDRMRWNQLFEEEDPKLLSNIRLFWEMRNPLPGRLGNLRLIEHWERIAFARDNFTREEMSPYGTDERGTYHVRYGEIDRRYEGQFSVNREVLRYQMNRYRFSTSSDISDYMLALKANESVANFTPEPEYDVWIYDGVSDKMAYNLALLFGQKGDGGFGRVYTIENFIPSEMLNPRNNERPKYPYQVGSILQRLYYHQLSDYDSYFRDLYDNMDYKMQTGSLHSSAWDFKFTNLATVDDIFENAPVELPTAERRLPEIPVHITQYRMLDESERPVFLSFVESYPSTAFLFNVTGGQLDEERTSIEEQIENEPIEFYNLVHGMQLLDSIGRQLSHTRFAPDIEIDLADQIPSTSVFPIPYVSPNVIQTFYVELENHDPNSEPLSESRLPGYIRGLGKMTVQQPDPLVNTGDLLMSDLILGFQRETNPPQSVFLPFVVSNNREIPEGENLAIHFEVYNLHQNSDGIANFELDYTISSVRQVLFWERVHGQDDASITLNFQTDTPRFAESVEIQTQGLETGEYELLWEIRDLNNGQQAVRSIRFQVVEPMESE